MEINELLIPTILGGICVAISVYGLAIAKDRKYALGGLFLYSLIPIAHRTGILLENPEDYFSLIKDPSFSVTNPMRNDSDNVGLEINFPSTIPIFAAPKGPINGKPDKVSAALVAIIATISESFSWSWDNTVHITWVSFLKSLWNKGRIGLSISLQISVSFSVGLASLLKKPPGIFPTE